ncbi:MAG: glycosyltransferase family 4 protein [Lachnospiraceae bacterium]|nr:glycosyltransferase family 4 protein [Lachnospiraceae bacterium]
MKVLWLCNIMLPAIANELNLPYSNREGWLSGLFNQFIAEDNDDGELAVCFPYEDRATINAINARIQKSDSGQTESSKNVLKFKCGRVTCYGFRENLQTPEKYDSELEKQMNEILEDYLPDIIHIFGSEFPHALALTNVCKDKKRILLTIQGLVGKIAKSYTVGLPYDVTKGETIRDIVKNDSIADQQEKFNIRAQHEQLLFALIKHVAGRTRFDYEAAIELNPNVTYHELNESMRESFYQGRWNSIDCEPYSIFVSQGDYPIKGLHYMLEAMPRLILKYPEAHLYVAGNDIVGDTNLDMMSILKKKVKISSYGKYLKSLILTNQLEDKVTMLGPLDEAAMKERFLLSSVFVCPSVVENSPNSLCEAMLLGMPVVAAAVGGIPSLLSDGKNGLLYEPGNVRDLTAAIEIAWDLETGEVIAVAAAKRAKKTHNRILNYMRLREIYNEIMIQG